MKKKISPRSRNKKSESVAHYESILLEEMRGDFKAVAEGVEMLSGTVERMKNEFTASLLDVKNELHGHVLLAKQDLRSYIVETKQNLSQEILKSSHSVLSRIDQLEEKILHHDEEIRLLKQA